MKISQLVFSVLACAATTEAYSVSSTASSRRAFVQSAATAAVVVGTTSSAADALEACPKGSKNCIRTTWTPPSGTSQSDIAATLKLVLNDYPQEGQNDVDKGGWAIVTEDLASSGKADVEYKSGVGNFAKFLNGGKPFVDDLQLEIKDGAVQVRSSSRVGDSDLGVNQKRLSFFAKALKAKGWDAPEPTY